MHRMCLGLQASVPSLHRLHRCSDRSDFRLRMHQSSASRADSLSVSNVSNALFMNGTDVLLSSITALSSSAINAKRAPLLSQTRRILQRQPIYLPISYHSSNHRRISPSTFLIPTSTMPPPPLPPVIRCREITH